MSDKNPQTESVNSKQPVLVANVLLRIERLDRDILIDGKPAPPIYIVTGSSLDVVFADDKYQMPSVDIRKAAGLCVSNILGISEGTSHAADKAPASPAETSEDGQPVHRQGDAGDVPTEPVGDPTA